MTFQPGASWVVLGGELRTGVTMLAQAEYHLEDLVPAADACRALGVPVTLIAPTHSHGPLSRWRTSSKRAEGVYAAARALGMEVGREASVAEIAAASTALVVRNDWGVSAGLVAACKERGVRTYGWVEGVQDFHDDDTGRARHAYRLVDEVLTLGEWDTAQLAGATCHVVGSDRLWRRWRGPASTHAADLVANVNFTYGVLEDARQAWVADVVAAAEASHRTLAISRHTADRGHRVRRLETSAPSSALLEAHRTLVSRFSTLCYDALVMGVALVYHNPHGERVPTFRDPMGAYRITTDRGGLQAALAEPVPTADDVRLAAAPFLRRHLAIDGDRPADAVAELLARR